MTPRLTEREIEKILAQRRSEAMKAAGLTGCGGRCDQGRSACTCHTAASAVSGIEDEDGYRPQRRERMGRLKLFERALMPLSPHFAVVAVAFFAGLCAIALVRG
jgi:hypothetical protein